MKAVVLFLRLKEEEYQSIRWLATTNTTSREQKAYLKQKTCHIFPIFVGL